MPDEEFFKLYNKRVEEERAKDFPQLRDVCYLDHAGATLYSRAQIDAVSEELKGNLFANPHSQSASSRDTTARVDEARELVASHFGVSLDDYAVVFTGGCSASLALVGQALDLRTGADAPGAFVFLRESHTSVVGLREVFRGRGAALVCVDDVAAAAAAAAAGAVQGRVLAALPGQCNFSGRRLPPGAVEELRAALGPHSLVLLDAAALAATSPVDLEEWGRPDLVTASFYKLFGYPSGLGTLLVRRDTAGPLLRKDYFGGGTQDAYLPAGDFHRDRPELHDRLEDGTLPFLAIAALKFGFDAMAAYGDEPDWIARHVFSLALHTRRGMAALRHRNGAPVVLVYAREDTEDWRSQGGVVAFNVLRPDGSHVGYSQVARMAELHKIHLRTGCFCNVGACQRYLGLSDSALLSNLSAGHVCGDSLAVVDGRPTGAVRASFGYMSTLDDAERLLAMLRDCFVARETAVASPDLSADLPAARLRQICVFPVKSCAPFRPRSWPLGPRGLLFDREWMVVDRRGAAVTLSQNSRLGRVRTRVDLAARLLVLSADGHADLELPVDAGAAGAAGEGRGARASARVCNSVLGMRDCGDAAARWLCAVLEADGLRLQRQEQARESPLHAGELSLNNQSHFLLINLETVRRLGEQLPDVLPQEELEQRFRANFVVDGMPALREDALSSMQIGEEVFKAVGPCTRCRLICVDKSSETMTREPLKTLMQTKSELTFGTYFMRCDTKDAKVSLDQPLMVFFKEQ